MCLFDKYLMNDWTDLQLITFEVKLIQDGQQSQLTLVNTKTAVTPTFL